MRRQRDQDPARPAASPDGAGVVRLSPRRRSFDAVPSSQRPKSCASSPPLRCLAGHGPPCTTGDDRLRRLAEPCPLLPAGPQPREQRHLQGLREDFLRDYARLNPRPDAISVPTGSAPLGSRAAYPMQSSPLGSLPSDRAASPSVRSDEVHSTPLPRPACRPGPAAPSAVARSADHSVNRRENSAAGHCGELLARMGYYPTGLNALLLQRP